MVLARAGAPSALVTIGMDEMSKQVAQDLRLKHQVRWGVIVSVYLFPARLGIKMRPDVLFRPYVENFSIFPLPSQNRSGNFRD
ncbi:hypothetical protein BEN47_03585 [Hymenobacter lapidarius]|uniref:Uncharacterized protein n=1 Tax=Hymenobacter lapidarius TaxID=1908237 RepID=A0A1G1SXQ9_9BACT|nr:hypothetical protein BEN47_03585 [Hymenobacter lapidarius]